jgi:hypothetical protein
LLILASFFAFFVAFAAFAALDTAFAAFAALVALAAAFASVAMVVSCPGADCIATADASLAASGDVVEAAGRAMPVPSMLALTCGSLRAPLTTSRNRVPGRKVGTLVFLIFTDCPVRGLRAIRAARARFSKMPKPVMVTLSPPFTVRTTTSTNPATAAAAIFLSPSRSARASIS